MEFLLNVKEIRFRAFSDRPGMLLLKVAGEGEVTAGDVQPSADYEVANPELHLATLDSPEATLTAELKVERGRGYVPAGHVDGLPIGVIPVDAIFTPIRKVNYKVERTRVGQMTNYDRLILEVWTDGTIPPEEAVSQSAEILIRHFAIFSDLGKAALHGAGRPALGVEALPREKYDMPIEDLQLSVRAYNCLKRSGINRVGEVLAMSEDQLMAVRNFGRKSLVELRQRLAEMGFITPEEAARQLAAGETETEESEPELPSSETESSGAPEEAEETESEREGAEKA